MTSTDAAVGKLRGSASKPAREEILEQIFLASLVPYETAVRLRKHFRIGPHYWTLIPAA